MGGIASWGRETAGTSGTQRGSLQGLPLHFRGRAWLFRGHGNATLGLQCQGNVSPKANPDRTPSFKEGFKNVSRWTSFDRKKWNLHDVISSLGRGFLCVCGKFKHATSLHVIFAKIRMYTKYLKYSPRFLNSWRVFCLHPRKY